MEECIVYLFQCDDDKGEIFDLLLSTTAKNVKARLSLTPGAEVVEENIADFGSGYIKVGIEGLKMILHRRLDQYELSIKINKPNPQQ